MYVVLFDVFLLLRKTDVLKTCPLALKSKKVEDIFGNTFIFSFVYKTVSQISFKLFFSGDKRLLSDFLREWGWFQGHNERFKKLRHGFVHETALITTALISSCHWKTLVPFCLRKKRLENAFLTLIVNYRKIVQENKLYHPK